MLRADLRRRLERRVLDQDRALQLLQGRARLDPELVDEQPARLLVHLQRLRLTAGAVESEHQLPAQALAQGMRGDERPHLSNELCTASGREVGLDSLLEAGQSELVEPRDLDVSERVVRELRERRTAPER